MTSFLPIEPSESSERSFQPLPTLPPASIDLEEAVLGAILLDPEAIGRVEPILTPGDFYVEANSIFYRAALSLKRKGLPTDMTFMLNHLKDAGTLEKIGGAARIVSLVDRVVSSANVDQYALLVQEKSERRRLIAVSNDLIRVAHDTKKPITDVFGYSEQRILHITQGRKTNEGLEASSDLLISAFGEIESNSLKEGGVHGLTCGLYDLDNLTMGFQRSDLIIPAGRPAMGKTSFAIQVARNIAAIHSLPIAIFSLEMSKAQLMYRLISMEIEVESQRLRSGRLTEHEWEKLNHGIGKLSSLPLFIDDTPSIGVSEIRSKCRRLMAETRKELGLVLVDYLQLMESDGDGRVQELSKITRGLKGLARELNVPVMALSQLSRNVESRTNKRPMMSDLRESGSLEQDADLVMMLYRHSYYEPEDVESRGIAEVIVAKHRNGPVGTVKLLFDPQFTRFRNCA